MFSKLKKINKHQKGFTLIELIVVIAITAVVVTAVTVTIFQLFSISARSDNHMLAVRQVQSAGHRVNLDTQMAQTVQPDESGATGFPLTLTWTEYGVGGDEHRVRYTLVNDKLQREHYTNYDPADPADPDSTIFVAEYIDSSEISGEPQTKCEFNDTDGDGDNDTLFLTVTATVSGWRGVTETRVYEIIPRPR